MNDTEQVLATRPNRPRFWTAPVVLAVPVALASLATVWIPALLSVGLLTWTAIRHRRSALWVALLCPLAFVPLISFSTGVITYLRGTAAFRNHGLPGIEFHNLDPKVRCWRYSSG